MMAHAHDHAAHSHAHTGSLVTDPVCGMSVDPATAKHTLEHDGQRYYFCSRSCLEKFQKEPDRYLPGSDGQPAAAVPPAQDQGEQVGETVIYTCPMHPEITQDHPGNCPICGMALEPATAVADEGANPELVDMTRRFWASTALTLPLLVVAMGRHIPGVPFEFWFSSYMLTWIEFILATPVVLWGGWPFFQRAWASVASWPWRLNMFTLIGLGVAVAWIYSVVATIAPTMFPDAFRDARGQVGVYYEAAAVIVTLVLLGQVLELRARSQTSGAIKALLGLAPKTARIVKDRAGYSP